MRRSHLMFWLTIVGGVGLLLAFSPLLFPSQYDTSLAAPRAQGGETEPNNDFDHANGLSMPGTVFGEARNQPITDTDFFSVPTSGGLNYRATLNIGGSGTLLLKILVYDHMRSYLTSSSSSSTSAEVTWSAYGPRYYIEIQPAGPTTITLLTANYVLDVLQIAATPTSTPQPTSTPTPTPQPPGPTAIPGADRFEPNYDFDHAATIAANITYEGLNFIPWAGGGEDNDFYKLWIKPGLFFVCETLDLDPGVDTNMILYDGNRNPIGGNDDVALGDYRSRISYYSTYEGFLYVLVGHGGRLPNVEVQQSGYSLRCTMEAPGMPTLTPTPRPTNGPGPTATSPSSPLPTPTSGALSVRPLATPTPPPSVSTPAPHFIPVDLLVYYDANGDRSPGAGEGVAGILVLAYDTVTGDQIAQGLTDEQGRLRFTATARGAVRLSIPFLGLDQLVGSEGGSIYVRIAPQSLSSTLP